MTKKEAIKWWDIIRKQWLKVIELEKSGKINAKDYIKYYREKAREYDEKRVIKNNTLLSYK